MSLLAKPSTTLAALAFGILVFGAGLTSPIWLIVIGDNPIQAIHNGTPIVVMSILGLMVTAVLAIIAGRLQKPLSAQQLAPVQAPKRNHTLVHVVVMLMFIIPFLTIVLGFIFKDSIEFTSN